MSNSRNALVNPFAPHDSFLIPEGTELLSLNQITGKSIHNESVKEVNIMLAHKARTKETSEGETVEAPSVVFAYGNLIRAVFLDESILKVNNKPIEYTTI